MSNEAQALARDFLDALLGGGEEARTRVDWPRWRLMQLMQGTAGVDGQTREQLLARGNFGVEAELRALNGLRSLVEILLPRGWRFVDGYDNPMLEGLRGGPADNAPPQLRRYLTLLQEIARAAVPVTIAGRDDDEGRKLMTLLFVGGKYVGFLPGSTKAPE